MYTGVQLAQRSTVSAKLFRAKFFCANWTPGVCPMKANNSKFIGFKSVLSHWNLLLKTNRTISKTWKSDQCNLFKTYSILFNNLSESKMSRSFFGVILYLTWCFSIICVKWPVSCGDLDLISTFTHNDPWLGAQWGARVWFYSSRKKCFNTIPRTRFYNMEIQTLIWIGTPSANNCSQSQPPLKSKIDENCKNS